MPTTPTPQAPANGTQPKTPMLNLTQAFDGLRLVVIGGTGFLGKVWVSMLLHHFPQIGQMYLLVRPKKNADSQQRFWDEIATSEVFEPLRKSYPGHAYKEFFGSKITPIPGDVSHPNVGIPEALLSQLKGKVDVVVNVAGVVDFNPPIDEALHVNCFGIKHIMQLCQTLGDVPIMHTSTCYVAGNKDGTFYEIDPRERPFPRCDEIDPIHWNPEREIEEGLRLVERANHEANAAFRESEFLEQAKERLRQRGESCRGEVLADELHKVRRDYVAEMLREEGSQRAHYWGWTNTYTYTKSMGEQLLMNAGLRATIVRPAVVESSTHFPFPGWNEGINTSAPLIYAILKRGLYQLPGSWDCNLDLIPVDMVCSGMIAALGALVQDVHKPVYQFGAADVNPASTGRLQEIISLYKRRNLRKNPKGHPFFVALQKAYGSTPISKEYFESYGDPAYSRVSKKLSSWTKKASEFPGLGFLKGTSKQLNGLSKVFESTTKVYNQFMPFMYERRYRFDCSNIRDLLEHLDPQDRDKIYWAPEEIDWRQWMMEVHIPALEKWVMPLIDDKMRKKRRPLRAYPNLVEMLEEVVDDNPYGTCVQKLIDKRLHTLTYKEFREGVYRAAHWLQAQGLEKGDRVLLAGQNSPYWAMAYFGILRAGGTAVPLDPALDPARLQNLHRSSNARFALWDQTFHDDAGHTLLDADKNTENTDTNDAKASSPNDNGAQATDTAKSDGTAIKAHLFAPLFADKSPLEAPTAVRIEADDVASLIFTSGTTGDPKGVMLTHKNFTSLLGSLVPLFPLNHEDSSLSLLPLHHTFEFTCGLLLPLSRGTRITYIEELNGEQLVTALQEARVTCLVGVPALWQLLSKRIRSQLKQRGAIVANLFEALFEVNHSIGKNLGVDFGKMLFAPIHKQLGGHLRYLISGGAALPQDTQKLFISLGLPLTEGYGLTEAAPVLAVAMPSRRTRFGEVGKAIPGVEIKIADANEQGIGEVIARGPNVMLGYADNPDATAKVIDKDGWLHTGDLGKIDHKGRLKLMGRAKEVIITSNGENVYPDDLEELIGLPSSVEELGVVGMPNPSGGEIVAVLAVPRKDDSESWHKRASKAREDLQEAFAKLPQHSRPTILHLQDDELPRTPTRKVKRRSVRSILEELEAKRNQDSEGSNTHHSHTIIEVITQVTGASKQKVSSSNRLATDLGIDSLTMAELHIALEKRLDTRIPLEQLRQCETVNAIHDLLQDLALQETHHTPWPQEDDETSETVQLPSFVQNAAKTLLRSAQHAFYQNVMDMRVYGRANIPHNRNTLVVANHNSHLDLGLIKTALGNYADDIVTLGAKDYFFKDDTWRKFYFENFTNVLPVDRKGTLEESLEDAYEALRKGKTALIFPEGTRSKSGQIAPFKPGVGVLARDIEIDLLPVYVHGSFQSMPKGRPVPTKRKHTVRIGEVIPSHVLHQKIADCDPPEAARRIAQIAQAAVESLRDRTYFDLQEFEVPDATPTRTVGEELQDVFAFLSERFDPKRVEEPVSFYFSLGNEQDTKWSVIVDKDNCVVHPGKPKSGVADCVLKTSPEIFRQIIQESYVPSPDQFISGAIKSNNIPLLQQLVTIFDL